MVKPTQKPLKNKEREEIAKLLNYKYSLPKSRICKQGSRPSCTLWAGLVFGVPQETATQAGAPTTTHQVLTPHQTPKVSKASFHSSQQHKMSLPFIYQHQVHDPKGPKVSQTKRTGIVIATHETTKQTLQGSIAKLPPPVFWSAQTSMSKPKKSLSILSIL